MAVYIGKTEILYRRIGRNRYDGRFVIIQLGIRQLHRRHLTLYVLHSVTELVCQVCSLDRLDSHFLPAVLGVFFSKFPEYHLRMSSKITVNGITLRSSSQMNPVRLFQGHTVPFLEKEDIRYNTGVCVPQKGIIRKADCPQKVCPVGDIFPHRFILLIHRSAGGHHGDDTAGTDEIQRFSDEVIMDQEVVPIVSGVRHLILPKRHISDHGIKKAVRE